MAGTQQLGVKYPIAFAAGDDFTLTLTATENAAAYVWGTVEAVIVGHATVTAFTVSLPVDGTCILSLTDAQTTALGAGGYGWYLRATKAGYSQTWLAGSLTAGVPQSPGSSAVSAAVTVTTGAATSITVTSTGGQTADATALTLPAASGSDDTSALNSAISAAGTRLIRGYPGSSYRISSPLVVRSNSTLDMHGCTVTLIDGSGTNMVQNYALTQAVSVVDAAMTSGSAVLTASEFTAGTAFTAAVVGQTITVQGAGAAGVPLTATVASRQSDTQITLTATASTTVVARYASIGARDTKITLRGGTWDRGANLSASTKGYDKNSIRMRKVDGLTIEEMSWSSTLGKYSVSVGDCTDFKLADITATSVISDVVHVNGPARNGHISNILSLYSYDDVVSLTAADFNTVGLDTMQDCVGDISNIVIDSPRIEATTAPNSSAVKMIAGRNPDSSHQYTIANVAVRNASGSNNKPLVSMGDDTQDVRTQLGNYRDITIDGARQEGTTQYAAQFRVAAGGSVSRLLVKDATVPTGGASDAIAFDGAATFDRITTVGINRRDILNSATAMTNLTIVDDDPPFGMFTDGNAETMHRDIGLSSTATLTSGVLILSYFRPTRDLLAGGARTYTSANASATPTLARIGLYTVSTSTGDITLVASSVNDTAMWSGTYSGYDKAFSAAYQLRAGTVYAFGVLYVGTTAPRIAGIASVSGGELLRSASRSVRLAASVTGQTDLPASVINASLGSSSGARIYAAVRA